MSQAVARRQVAAPVASSRLGRRWTARGAITAVSAIILAYCLLPFVWMFIVSIAEEHSQFVRELEYLPSHPTLANYVELFNVMPFARYIGNSMLVAVATMLLTLGVSVTAAYAFVRFQFPGRKIMIVGMLLVYMLPSIVLLVPLLVIFKTLGMINTYQSLILAETTHAVPFAVWLLTGYFAALPRELEESALVDGCTPFGALMRIVLPLSIPGIVAAGLFVFIASWNNFIFAFMFTSGEEVRTLPVVTRFFVQGEADFHWGIIMASAVMTTLPVAILFLFFQRYLIRGLTDGSVKG
jgi:multiple sugar transport system permease protein